MKICEIISEATYPGNIGMMEMFQFYRVANDTQKNTMKSFLEKKQFKKAWDFLQKVLGVKLHEV